MLATTIASGAFAAPPSPAAVTPNDPGFAANWGLSNTGQLIGGVAGVPGADISAPAAWDVTTGSSDVTVAVVDTGVAYTLSDLAGNVDASSNKDFVGSCTGPGWTSACGDSDARDSDGLGTAEAGTIGAIGNNGAGVAGVAWKTRIMPVRVCAAYGEGCPPAAMTAGLAYAADHGARIVESGAIAPDASDAVRQVIAGHPGTLFVVPAGDGGLNLDASPQYPCAYRLPNVLCVAASDQADRLAPFSNRGAQTVDLAAPGTSVTADQAAKTLFSDDFETSNFSTKWTLGGTSSRWARTSEAHGTWSLTDSPGANYPANANTYVSTRSSWSTVGYTGCSVSFHLWLAKLSDATLSVQAFSTQANAYQTLYSAFADDVDQDFSLSLSSRILDEKTGVRLRFRLATGAGGADGAHIDNVRFTCRGLPADAGTTLVSGTAYAAAYTAGAAALVWGRYPDDTVTDVRQAILDGADPLPGLAGTSRTGARLDAYRALVKGDRVPPDTQLDVTGPDGPTSDPDASFDFSASEPATFQCRLDGGDWTPCASGLHYGGTADGDHSFAVRAIDWAGNADPTPAQRSWTVDTTPPNTAIVSAPQAVAGNANARFQFSSSETDSLFQCRLDGGDWRGCLSPTTFAGLPDGAHTVDVRAIDQAGNLDPVGVSRSFAIDTEAPATRITSAPRGATSVLPALVAFSTPDATAGFQCRSGMGRWRSCTSPALVTVAGPDWQVRAVDPTGNADPTPAQGSWSLKPARRPRALATALARTLAAGGSRAFLHGLRMLYRPRQGGRLEVSVAGAGRQLGTARVSVRGRRSQSSLLSVLPAARRLLRKGHAPMRAIVRVRLGAGRASARTRIS